MLIYSRLNLSWLGIKDIRLLGWQHSEATFSTRLYFPPRWDVPSSLHLDDGVRIYSAGGAPPKFQLLHREAIFVQPRKPSCPISGRSHHLGLKHEAPGRLPGRPAGKAR